jgi:DNA-binding NtrC family response regulator
VETETDIYASGSGQRRTPSYVLYIAFHGHEPTRPPSRHVIGDIDVVSFGRGETSVTRDREGGLRRLVVRVADPLISSQHGELVHAQGVWVLATPNAKNGAIVGGVRTRSSRVLLGQVFSLGHTLFLIQREEEIGDAIESPAALDVSASELPAPVPELATFDPAFGATVEQLARVAPTQVPILLLGETGTGKEVAARAIHELSRRRGSFVGVNCGAISATLVESELFGHRRGAFSGATADRLGHVRTADHGTLFLDEIGDMPLPAQAALLRVLEEREVVPVGDSVPVPVDLRVCAATHRDLGQLVAEGKFREDLYARIRGLQLTLPPLRARRVDLGILIPALLRRQAHAAPVRFTPQAASLLFEYSWPRNIRELSRALEVMTAMAGGQPIAVDHLPEEIRAARPAAADAAATAGHGGGGGGGGGGSGATLASVLAEAAAPAAPAAEGDDEPLTAADLERKESLEALLREHRGNVTEVARRLGKDRTQIYRWIRRYRIRVTGVRHEP